MALKIQDYSFDADNMLVMYSIAENKPNPNTFQFNPRHCDVIEMAMTLDIIENVEDYDNGLGGQALRVGFDFFGTDKVTYFGYTEVISWIGGESLEFIALRLAQKHFKENQTENKLLVKLI